MASLRIGSAGDDVRRLQITLNLVVPVAPSLTVDGIFGPNTQARVIELQKRSQLVADGVVGPLTTKALVGSVLTVTLRRR